MTTQASSKPFTGRKMAAILIVGFGIVVAVNFTMASLATSGFHGMVVENSYVASQNFNDWLEEAEASRALGWEATAERGEDGFVTIRTSDAPQGAVVSAELRRPIGVDDRLELAFQSTGPDTYRSTAPVDTGRWTVRLRIASGEQVWAEESALR